jgi:SAM-dependent methyltransferase
MKPLERHLVEQYELPPDYFWHDVRGRAVQRFLPPGPITLLDVGAGTGRLGAQLACTRPEVSYRFIEPIEVLEAHLEAEFGAAANAAFDAVIDADVVTLLDVIEHQPDDVTFLSSLASRSAPNTRFVITVPASMRLWSAWDVELGHYRRYTRATLAATMRRAGLDVSELSYLFPELWPVAIARRARHPATSADLAAASPEFRALPPSVNAALRGVGRITLPVRRFVPFGTSVLAVATTLVSAEGCTR